MKYIAFIGAEHHVRYLYFICDYFQLEENDLIVFFFNSRENTIKNNSRVYSFSNLYFIFEHGIKDLLLNKKYRNQTIKIWDKVFKPNDSFLLFSSISYDYSQIFKAGYNNTKIYLLDDGFGFFSNLEYFNSFRRYKLIFRSILLSFLFYKKVNTSFDIYYFTEFRSKYLKNNFDIIYARKQKKLLTSFINNDFFIILGTPYVERNMLDLNRYLEIIKRIVLTYKKRNILYYPHRIESQFKLNLISELNVNICKSTVPFETYFESLNEMPCFIISFMSSHAGYELIKKYFNPPSIIFVDDLSNKNISSFLSTNLRNTYLAVDGIKFFNLQI